MPAPDRPASDAASRRDNPEAWVSGGHEKFETPVRAVSDGAVRRERLLIAIADALPAPATEKQQQEILDAIDELERNVAREVLDRRRGSVLRVVALCELETKDNDAHDPADALYEEGRFDDAE